MHKICVTNILSLLNGNTAGGNAYIIINLKIHNGIRDNLDKVGTSTLIFIQLSRLSDESRRCGHLPSARCCRHGRNSRRI